MTMQARRRLMAALAGLLVAPAAQVRAAARAPGAAAAQAQGAGALRSITEWLKRSGRDGFLAAEVADAAGIPRAQAESMLGAKQRGFRNDDVLRIAQVSADERRDFLLFMVQRPEGEVYFYICSVHDGLRRAFVSAPRAGVSPLEAGEAHENFELELRYWQARAAES